MRGHFYFAPAVIVVFSFFLSTSLTSLAQELPVGYSGLDPVTTGSYTINIDLETETAQISSDCDQGEIKSFEKGNECLAFCGSCVLRDDLCWYCIEPEPVQEVAEENFWAKMKNWFVRVFRPNQAAQPAGQIQQQQGFFRRIVNAVANFFSKKSSEEIAAELAEDKLKSAAQKVFDHSKAKQEGVSGPSEEEVDAALDDAFSNAESFADLIKLKSLMVFYCSNKYPNDWQKEQECQNKFMAKIRERGDELKHRLLDAIDPTDTSAETYNKMRELYALLLAGTSASGEGVLFSTDNMLKVKAQLKEKAAEWFINVLNGTTIENIGDWYIFALSHTGVYDRGIGLMDGSIPLANLKYRARRLVLQQMAAMNICNPDPEKLKALQELLSGENPGCDRLLGDSRVCDLIMKGDLEEAYKTLYEMDADDEASGQDPNKAPEPVVCKKTEAVTPPAVTAEEGVSAPDSGGQTVEDGGGEEPPQTNGAEVETGSDGGEDDRDDTSGTEEYSSGNGAETDGQTGDYEFGESDGGSGAETQPEPYSEDETAGEPPSQAESEGGDENEPEPEESVCQNGIVEAGEECDDGNSINGDGCSFDCLFEPEPEFTCDVQIFSDPITGWDYSISNCEWGYYEAYDCFFACGAPPPMVVAEETEEENLCYETAGGFVDYSFVLPCRFEPEPPPETTDCVSSCLRGW